MKYIKIDKDTFIEYNEETQATRVISKSETERLVKQEEDWLDSFNDLSDEDLLVWAKENHREYKDKVDHENSLEVLENLLKNLK